MPFKNNYLILCVILYILLPVFALHGAEKNGNDLRSDADSNKKRQLLYSMTYFYPIEESRNIRTANINAFYPFHEFEKINLSLYAVMTATYATGDITQLEGELEEGTLREVNFENSAFGIGPGLSVDMGLLRVSKLSFHLNGTGSFILYNNEFPAGGDYYNFMWRGGPKIEFDFGRSRAIGLLFQWMHVSNGQGVGSQNPSYDAEGVALQFTGFF